MSFIGAWITNIILIILFAVLLELLIPNSKIERYVKLVVGLMLLMVMLQPLLSIFQIDPEQWLDDFTIFESEPLTFETSSMESQKRDIEMDNLAYISEYTAVQLKNEASKELQQKYEVVLADVKVEFEQYKDLQHYRSEEDLLENLSSVHVFLQKLSESQAVDEVELVIINPVSIGNEERNETGTSSEDEPLILEMTTFLANIWMIPKEKLHVVLKGGEE